MLLIGSEAANHHGLDLGRRFKDVDVIATYEDINRFVRSQYDVRSCMPMGKGKKIVAVIGERIWEFEIAWEGSTAAALLERTTSDRVEYEETYFRVPDLSTLYTIKLSHRYLKDSPHFLKTMRDIQKFRAAGCTVPEDLKDWLKLRQKETYHYGHPNLNVKKGDFFKGDGIEYVYDHDTIHEAMKHMERPAYTYFKKDGADVACDKEKFFATTAWARLYSVLEEGYVLALERSQIPFKGKVSPRKSFDIALSKVCTSITSGWWREFAWENYDNVVKLYDPDYVVRFWQAVESGIVKSVSHQPALAQPPP